MELIKNKMNTSIIKALRNIQITLDDDVNVPDSKPDMDRIIQSKGEAYVLDIDASVDKVTIQGELKFSVLYATAGDGNKLGSFSHPFSFEETVHMDGVLPMDTIKVNVELDDLTVNVINSRKLSIRSLISIHVVVSDIDLVEGAIDINDSDGIESCHKKLNMTQLVVNKKDTARIREEVTVSANKPNVYQILWDTISLRNQETKPLDGKISIRGELLLFVLYQGEEEHIPIQNLEWEIPFHAELDCPECQEGMIGNITMCLGNRSIEVKPDADGEERMLELECSLDLDVKIYEEGSMNFLWDVYAPTTSLDVERNKFSYEHLIIKNNAKTRIAQRFHTKESQAKLLQICHVEGTVKIDDTQCTQDGIQVEGVVEADLIYIAGDDKYPINCVSTMVPFSYLVEAKGITQQDNYDIMASLEQMNAIMIDGDEIEVKAVINLDIIAFKAMEGTAIIGVEKRAFDAGKFQKLPGIVGYIVKAGDTLWDIAKMYYTTVANIKEMNDLEDDEINVGDKLVLVKQVEVPSGM